MAAGSIPHVETAWGSWTVAVAFVGAALALGTLLAAAVRLVVMDWLAEIRARAAWTAAIAPLGTMLTNEHALGDQLYEPAGHDEAIRAILRAHRHTVPRHAVEPMAEPESSDGTNQIGSSRSIGARECAAAVPDGHSTAPRPDRSDMSVGESHDQFERSGTRASAERGREAWTVGRASAPLGSASWRKRQPSGGFRLATRVLRIVNGGARNGADSSLRVIGVPVKVVSDIVVLGQGKNGRSNTEPLPGAPLSGGPIRAGPVTSIAGSTAASPTRHHRQQTDPTAFAEARQQVIALAEALARAAAREDDAAEQREERSRSPPDSSAEQSPSGGAKDDTS
jgi:hypothetical protein